MHAKNPEVPMRAARSHACLAAALAALTAGCDFGTLDDLSTDTAIDAPSEMTVAARSFWTAYAKASGADVKKEMAGIEGVIQRTSTVPMQVKIGDLTKAETDLVLPGKDPTPAQGMLIVTELDCPLDKVEQYVIASNQSELYPGLYDEYKRSYTSSAAEFLSRAKPDLTWRTDYKATALSRSYLSELTGGAWRVPDASPTGGPVLLSRTYLNKPANFISGEPASFNQDYQIEVYWEVSPGRTRHLYGLWREFSLTTLTSESDLYISIVLGNLSDFDARTSKICRSGTPAPITQ